MLVARTRAQDSVKGFDGVEHKRGSAYWYEYWDLPANSLFPALRSHRFVCGTVAMASRMALLRQAQVPLQSGSRKI